jgi:hypothetical protein
MCFKHLLRVSDGPTWFAFPFWEMLLCRTDVRKCTLWSMCICRDFSNNGLVALPHLQNCRKKPILGGTYKQHGKWSGPASTSCTNCLLSWVSNLWSVLPVLCCHVIKVLTVKGKMNSSSNHHNRNRYVINKYWYFIFHKPHGLNSKELHVREPCKEISEVWKLLKSGQAFSLSKYSKI